MFRMSSCDRLSQTSCTRCRNSAMVVAGSAEGVSSCFIMSHLCSISEKSGVLAGQGSCTPRRARCVIAAICGCMSSCWKSSSPSSRINDSSTGVNSLCNVAGSVYFTLQKHQVWPRVITDGPHTMKPVVRPLCHGQMQSWIWHSPGVCRTCVRPSLVYTQNLLPSLKTTEHHSTLQTTLHETREAMLGSVVV